MKILVTGGTGFIGRNIVPALREHHDVTLCGRSAGNDIKADLATEIPSLSEKYDLVVHAAGKAYGHGRSEDEIREFFDVNLEGTKNLCTALERAGVPDSLVFISSVAVYGCEEGDNIDESHPLDGKSAYASSKIQAEQYLTRWCAERGVRLGILRPALVVGANPPGNLGAMISGIKSGRYLRIGQGEARKSMLMVDDLPRLIELVSEHGGVYNVCDNQHPSFRELEDVIASKFGRLVPTIPYWFAKISATVGDCLGSKAPINSQKLSKISKSLTFSNAKARKELGWEPTDVLPALKNMWEL